MDFKQGDHVFYHKNPGEVDGGIIRDLEGSVKKYDLFETREEAEAAWSPDGKRMAGCLNEAWEIYCGKWPALDGIDRRTVRDDMIAIAFKLFDAGGD